MFVLLPVKNDTILKKKCYEKNTVKFFCFESSKIIFALLTKVIINNMVITFINIINVGFKEMISKIFCSCESGFYYCSK